MVKQEPDDCENSPPSDSLQTSVNNIHSNTIERADNNKRRASSNEEETPSKQAARIATLFLSSEDDPTAVGIICKHIKEFSHMCKSNGYELSIELVDDGDRIDVKLTQLVAVCGIRKVFNEMETLIQSKSDREKTLEKELTTISEQLEIYKQKSTAVTSSPSTELALVKEEGFPIGEKKTHNRNQRKEGEMETAKQDNRKEKISANEQNLRTILNSTLISGPICSTIRPHIMERRVDSPFYRCSFNPNDRCFVNILLKYVDHLQDHMHDCSNPNQMICAQFFYCWDKFLFKPSQAVLREKSAEWRKKFKLIHNVVGTVHFLQFKDDNGSTYFYCFAFISQAIVSWSVKSKRESALKKLRKQLSEEWNCEFKFATNMPVDCSYNEPLVYSDDKLLFAENNKVITWMRNNFKCLHSRIYGDHFLVLPSFYNMIINYVEIQ